MESSLFEKLKDLDIVYRGSVELKHAGISDFYIDVKKAYGYPDLLNALADELYVLMKRTNGKINCVSGNGYGGIPLSTAISSRHGLKNILVRNEPKSTGGAAISRATLQRGRTWSGSSMTCQPR